MFILLGISDQRYITYFEKIFQIFVMGCNTIFLIVMMTGILCIYCVAKKSYNSLIKFGSEHDISNNIRMIHNARLLNIALRLILLVACNVLTWLPFMIVFVLLLGGQNVHENVQQWVVVLGLPLCASTDPILYNLATLKTSLHRAKQA